MFIGPLFYNYIILLFIIIILIENNSKILNYGIIDVKSFTLKWRDSYEGL